MLLCRSSLFPFVTILFLVLALWQDWEQRTMMRVYILLSSLAPSMYPMLPNLTYWIHKMIMCITLFLLKEITRGRCHASKSHCLVEVQDNTLPPPLPPLTYPYTAKLIPVSDMQSISRIYKRTRRTCNLAYQITCIQSIIKLCPILVLSFVTIVDPVSDALAFCHCKLTYICSCVNLSASHKREVCVSVIIMLSDPLQL